MTDKQIIIYKKECYNEPHCSLNQVLEQLKAKEQECEKKSWEIGNLGYKIKNQRKEINIRLEQLDQLKAENDSLKRQLQFEFDETLLQYSNELDRLKAENEELKKLLKARIEDLCDSCGASSMMPMPCKVYEKALTEIKEIALKACECCGECQTEFSTKDYCDFNEILQKISEVEDEHNG